MGHASRVSRRLATAFQTCSQCPSLLWKSETSILSTIESTFSMEQKIPRGAIAIRKISERCVSMKDKYMETFSVVFGVSTSIHLDFPTRNNRSVQSSPSASIETSIPISCQEPQAQWQSKRRNPGTALHSSSRVSSPNQRAGTVAPSPLPPLPLPAVSSRQPTKPDY